MFFAKINLTFNAFLNVDSAPHHSHNFQYYHLKITVNFMHMKATWSWSSLFWDVTGVNAA